MLTLCTGGRVDPTEIWEEENQLDVTQCFIEHVICSTCFEHIYAHHQELATVLQVSHVARSSVKGEW